MVYPTLPADADAVSIFDQGLSPYYDITWSVTYRVDGLTPGDEIGLCMFLQDQTQTLSGGGVGIDLGYSGLSADNLSYPTSVGMLSAVVGIGLDSTGQFPLSVQWPDGTIRDGLNVADRVLNSVSIRGSYPNYLYLSGSNTEITEFDIADSQKKTLRARLGNYGRTIYLDYKRADDDSFTNILTKDVNIPFSETTRFRPGVSITKPISSNVSPTTNEIVVEAFHVEGLDENPTSSELEFTPLTIYSQNTSISVDPPVVCPPSLPPLPPLPPEVMPRPLVPFQRNCGEVINGSSVDSSISSSVYRLSGQSGFVTMSYTLSSPPLSSIDTSLSAASYEFETTAGTEYGQLSVNILSSYFDDFSQWSINEGSTVKFENLDSIVNGEVLTVVGFNGYPDICTLWVDESAADGLSISASYCSEYLSAFTMVLTGDYSYTGTPSGTQIPSSSNDLYKVVTRFDKPTPVRFKLEYDDEPFYDTAYVGSEEYSYQGAYRQDFINAINDGVFIAGFTSSSDLIAGLDEALIAPDGYPWVTPILSGSNTYTKVSDSVRAKVTVYDILSSKDWSFTLSCPVTSNPPISLSGCANVSSAKFSEKGGGLFTRETITLNQSGEGVATLTLDPVTVPDRFIVVYDNQTVIDTGYVSYGIKTITGGFLYTASYWTDYMRDNAVISNFKKIWANQSYYDLIDRFNITFAPCGQELQQSPKFNLRPADGSPYIGVSPPFVQLVSDISPDSLTFTTVPSANTVDVFVISPINSTGWSFNLSLSSFYCGQCIDPPTITWVNSTYSGGNWVNNEEYRQTYRPDASTECGGTNSNPQSGISTGTFTVPDGFELVIDWTSEITVETQNEFYDYGEVYFDTGLVASHYSLGLGGGCTPSISLSSGTQIFYAGNHEIDLIWDTIDEKYTGSSFGIDFQITSACLRPTSSPPPSGPCLPEFNYTELCADMVSLGISVNITGSVNEGFFSGVWDNYGTPTTATLTWDGSAWIFDAGDGFIVDLVISTFRCSPTGIYNDDFDTIVVTTGSCP